MNETTIKSQRCDDVVVEVAVRNGAGVGVVPPHVARFHEQADVVHAATVVLADVASDDRFDLPILLRAQDFGDSFLPFGTSLQ